MSQPLVFFGMLAIAAVACAAAIPAVRAIAERLSLLDYPDGSRHHHPEPVPRLGGVAVFVGLLVAITMGSLLFGVHDLAPWGSSMVGALIVASAILFLIGLLDDLRGVSPAFKLTGQTLAAAIVISFGFQIDVISFVPGHSFSLGVLSIPITALWLVGVSNAFNLVDGMDGLAGGVGFIAVATIAASALALGSPEVALGAAALGGALLGFLRYNWAPARIFLGDSGSLVVGFLLAVLAVQGSTTSNGVLLGLVPILALSYLLLDTGIAMLRRWLRGAPLSRADGRHIHHQLMALGLTPRRAATVIYVQSAFVAVLGLCVTFMPSMTITIWAVGFTTLLAILVYGLRWLEYHEFLEAGASVASALRKARTSVQDRILARDVVAMLRSAQTLHEVNDIIRNHASAFRFVHMDILYADAALGKTVRAPDHIGSATWLLEYPIAIDGTSHELAGAYPEAVLAIWSAVKADGRPSHPYRVAQILAPGIATALKATAGSGETQDSRPRQRSSGSYYYPRRRVSSEHRRVNDIPMA